MSSDQMEAPGEPVALVPRGYQLEMVELSLRRNIIVAIPTGGGKTLIGALRIEAELGKSKPGKRVWFLCPTVALAAQQCEKLRDSLPPTYGVRLLCGEDGVDHWSTQKIWDTVLTNVSVVVCTYQVLTDALESGFVRLAEISLLVIDEAHHCRKKHPSNRIMQDSYHPAKRKGQPVPTILGLTATPVIRKPDELKIVEANLDAVTRMPKIGQDEMLQHVHLPRITNLVYPAPVHLHSDLLTQLKEAHVLMVQNVSMDPKVQDLAARGVEKLDIRQRQDLHEAVHNGRTWCQSQAKRLYNVSIETEIELGYYSLWVYLKRCLEKVFNREGEVFYAESELRKSEIEYLCRSFSSISPGNREPDLSDASNHSPKLNMLIENLVPEMEKNATAIVFVKTRASVRLLADLLAIHPRTCNLLRIGTFVGSSSIPDRPSHIAELIDATGQENTLDDLRKGVKNIIIATNAAEEGIDISACNLVVCFNQPASLKSFIQQRGRARKPNSKLFVMFSAGDEVLLRKWQNLEKEMRILYINEQRSGYELEQLKLENDEYREFVIPSTEAKLLLTNATERLHHFCSKILSGSGKSSRPVFVVETENVSELKSCAIYLPNDLDERLRLHRSHKAFKTGAEAKKDAAFEAVLALYNANLLNEHLLPLTVFDEDAANARKQIESRANIVETEEQINIWRILAQGRQRSTDILYQYACTVGYSIDSGTTVLAGAVRIISTLPFPPTSGLTLYLDPQTEASVDFSAHRGPEKTLVTVGACHATRTLLRAGMPRRVSESKGDFVLLCVPEEALGNEWHWALEEMNGSFSGAQLRELSAQQLCEVGIIRDISEYEKPYLFQSIHWVPGDIPGNDSNHASVGMKGSAAKMLRARRLPKRKDIMRPIKDEVHAKHPNVKNLDFENCKADRLPAHLGWFSILVPSVYHHLTIHWTAEHLRTSLMSNVFREEDLPLIITAISAPRARERADYQRLEFLGDNLLKVYTTLALMVANPYWHEGYLSSAKDQIVSNSHLALICQRLGLPKYILHTPFTGAKWKCPYLSDFEGIESGENDEKAKRELSTKVLADVVEALIGASWLAGGEETLLKCFQIFLPSMTWRSSSESLSTLRTRASSATAPEHFMSQLTQLVGHSFRVPTLLLEAMTPSGVSSGTGSLTSYQRLEFLGDALLDLAVTIRLYSHPRELPERYMHRVRTAAVNSHFLAFFALSRQIEVTTMKPIIPVIRGKRKPSRQADELAANVEYESEKTKNTLISYLRGVRSPDIAANLSRMQERFERWAPDILQRLVSDDSYYPWAELAAFDSSKVASDIVESILAAIVIDHGALSLNLGEDAVSPPLQFLARFGVLPWLNSVISRPEPNGPEWDPFKVWHPKEEIGFLAVQQPVTYQEWSHEESEWMLGKSNSPNSPKLPFGSSSSPSTPLPSPTLHASSESLDSLPNPLPSPTRASSGISEAPSTPQHSPLKRKMSATSPDEMPLTPLRRALSNSQGQFSPCPADSSFSQRSTNDYPDSPTPQPTTPVADLNMGPPSIPSSPLSKRGVQKSNSIQASLFNEPRAPRHWRILVGPRPMGEVSGRTTMEAQTRAAEAAVCVLREEWWERERKKAQAADSGMTGDRKQDEISENDISAAAPISIASDEL